MKEEIKELIEISRFYGNDKSYVIAGGGNTSFKDEKTLWIKASGEHLSELTEDNLVALNREKLRMISSKKYSDDPVIRESQIKDDLNNSIIDTSKKKRPSVETSLHEMIRYKFIVHLHPTLINGVLCSRNAKSFIQENFGDKTIFVPYTDPGYTLFKRIEKDIALYRETNQSDPKIIFLENHGAFVSADSTSEISNIYRKINTTVKKHLKLLPETEELPYNSLLHKVLPAMRMLLSEEKTKVIRYRHNSLIARYYSDQQEFHKISLPLIPDIIVYCRTHFIYIEQSATAEKILDSFRIQLPRFVDEYGYLPSIVVIKDMGLLAIDVTTEGAETVLDIYEELIKVSHYALQSGGIKLLTPEQVNFIDKWEVENYRRKRAKADDQKFKLANKIAIITGGAQGFGAGIAESLYKLGLNVIIADINDKAGIDHTKKLNAMEGRSKAIFVKTDVSDPASVKELLLRTVNEFGGLDIMISNAGILTAGGLDEMEPEVFAKVTDIDYNGYYYCAKYAAEVMKLQNMERPDYYTDIIQINSKSGLRGSNRNFAYSGAKFGGIGLTQSFAMELAPFRIKVNSICPGNFYEGSLWSDPQNGLFVQYLKTGKVPGAKTIEDVRQYYEDQVPMKRGCRLKDVVKALLYLVDQEYETGQALPVTGGQVMLG